MNLARRIAALQREIGCRMSEPERIERPIEAGDITREFAESDFVKKYLADIASGIEAREAQIKELERISKTSS